jgi:hypothetical protein
VPATHCSEQPSDLLSVPVNSFSNVKRWGNGACERKAFQNEGAREFLAVRLDRSAARDGAGLAADRIFTGGCNVGTESEHRMVDGNAECFDQFDWDAGRKPNV